MGEFVGLDPGGASQLIRDMESAKGVLAATRPGMESAIAQAGGDWAGSGGVTAMHRAWAFFHESQGDLKWRIDTITQLHPSGGRGMLTGRLPFQSETEAAAAGGKAGVVIGSAFAGFLAEGSPESWKKVEAAMTAARTGAADPAYGAALLTALGGPAAYRTLFGQWMSRNATGPRRGLPPEAMGKAKNQLGPLAAAFAGADRAGRLDGRWRQELLEKANPATLSAVVALARTSGSLLNQVAQNLLRRPTAGGRLFSPDPDWNTHWLLKAYESNPAALQALFAEHKDAPALFLHPDIVKGTTTPAFENLLAGVLDKALSKDAGNAAAREMAWYNLINGFSDANPENLTGAYLSLENSPINEVLAEHVGQYREQLALVQVNADAPELSMGPATPWSNLKPEAAARFLGAVIQGPAAMAVVHKQFQEYLVGMDIGKAHPFSSDPAERAEYVRMAAKAGGLANILLRGTANAELNDDEYAEMIADIALLPADFLVNTLNVGPGASTGIGYLANGPKDDLADMVKGFLDDTTTETASTVADKLVREEYNWIVRSLEAHGQKALTLEDGVQLRNALEGQLHSALTDALKNRGG